MTLRRALLLVFPVGLVFLASMLRSTGGRASLPLDDSFIYFQYARHTAAGHPFVYQSGEAPTTGTTSIPWMLLLSIGALTGFDGKAMIFFAMILGGIALAVCVRFAGSAEANLLRSGDGSAAPPPAQGLPLAALLVALSGPLHWGAWSGMEIAYFAALVAWSFAELARTGGRPDGRAALAAALLATARPEGALLALVIAGLWVARSVAGREARGLRWVAVPVAAAFLQPLVNFALTGDARSSGMLAKTLLAAPGTSVVDALRIALLRAASLGAALFGGIAPLADGRGLYAYESEGAALWVPPGAALLFLIGVLPEAAREWRERKPGPALLGPLWIATLLVSTCALEEPDAHFSRYQMPILPVFLIWTAVGARRIGLERLAQGVRGWLVATAGVALVFFAAAFGDNCQDIERMQIRLGETLAEALPPDAVVAINDAGAIAYFSGRRTLDLVGLTTPGLAGLWPQGSGVLWESLESRPPQERPDWFCYFPNWFELDNLGVLRPQGSVRLIAPSIVDAEKVLAACDWSLAESGNAPRFGGADVRVVDRLDVADVRSERAHDFRWWNDERGADAGSFVHRAGFAGRAGDEAIDGGRTVFGEVEFHLARDPASAVTVVVRTPGGLRQRALVSVDGGAEQPVEIYAPGGTLFHEQAVAKIPPGAGAARVRMRLPEEAAASLPLVLAHVFALAGAEE